MRLMRSPPKNVSRVAFPCTWVEFGILFARIMVHLMTYMITFSDPYFKASSHNSVAHCRRTCFERKFTVPDKVFNCINQFPKRMCVKCAEKNLLMVFDIDVFFHLTLQNLIMIGY